MIYKTQYLRTTRIWSFMKKKLMYRFVKNMETVALNSVHGPLNIFCTQLDSSKYGIPVISYMYGISITSAHTVDLAIIDMLLVHWCVNQ